MPPGAVAGDGCGCADRAANAEDDARFPARSRPGQVALDSEGANSPFSAALSRHIGTPGLEVQQMLTRVRAEVVSSTRNKQVPWSNSSLLGEVYLAEK
jgi:uncharacterized caspase-like protein